ncbi:MAG: hypothetical protein Q8P13_00175 [bacterium]|nr:hypothetical protein [bacterium]
MAKAAQKPQELNINLLQKEEVGGVTGDLIKWVLTIGRYLIIVTEIIALATFLFGIKLAADKNDLKGKVAAAKIDVDTKAKCNEADPTAFCEDNFLALQDRINQVGSGKNTQIQTSAVVKEFLSLLPNELNLTTLSLESGKISFNGYFPDSVTLQTLIISLGSSKSITDLDIQELNSPSSKNTNFTFKAEAVIDTQQFTAINTRD